MAQQTNPEPAGQRTQLRTQPPGVPWTRQLRDLCERVAGFRVSVGPAPQVLLAHRGGCRQAMHDATEPPMVAALQSFIATHFDGLLEPLDVAKLQELQLVVRGVLSRGPASDVLHSRQRASGAALTPSAALLGLLADALVDAMQYAKGNISALPAFEASVDRPEVRGWIDEMQALGLARRYSR